jgi:hypothetical protein
MKNLVIIGLSSLLLFSVSAGLSMWLKQSKEEAAQADAKKDAEKEKKVEPKTDAKDDHGKPAEKKADDHGKPAEKKADDHGTAAKKPEEPTGDKDKVEQLRQQLAIVQHDMKLQTEALNKLTKDVLTESKVAKAQADDADSRAATLKKEKEAAEKAAATVAEKAVADAKKVSAQAEVLDPASVEKMAMMMEKMEADEAAKSLQGLADKGNMDAAVKVLNRMKDAKAAAVLTAVKDDDLRNQFLTKLLATRRPMK